MSRPQPQPVLRKAPRKEHPYAPASVPAPDAADTAANPVAAIASAGKAEQDSAKREKVFSTRLEHSLIRRVKARALEEDISVQTLVAAALTEYLDRNDS